VDYAQLYQTRYTVLRKAYEKSTPDAELAAFVRKQRKWLNDYALFMAIKNHFGMAALSAWPDRAAARDCTYARKTYGAALRDEIGFQIFLQYHFFKQWAALKAYANGRGVRIIGDIPIYDDDDSVELWARPELFQLNDKHGLKRVAGVPPDLFSETGQLWGNPLYDWERMEQDGFQWWIERVKNAAALYDVVRIDHFRGFESYWSIPASAKTAVSGKWVKGPAMKWYGAVQAALPKAKLIAEDLGILTPAVFKFLDDTGLPGLRLLIYAFDVTGDSIYLPHNIPVNSVAYTSNHDSPTFVQWLTEEATPEEADFAAEYLRLRDDEGLAWGAVKAVWASPAKIAVAAFQDILGLGGDARINVPSTLGGRNWRWRVRPEAMNQSLADKVKAITLTYRRNDWQ